MPPPPAGSPSTPGSSGPPPPGWPARAGAARGPPRRRTPTGSSARASAAGPADRRTQTNHPLVKEPEMSLSTFSTPSPITVALDLYVADVRFAVSDRTDTVVDVRPNDPDKAADVKAAENTRVEYDDATRTLSIVSRKPRSRFANFSSKRPESIDFAIQLPHDADA